MKRACKAVWTSRKSSSIARKCANVKTRQLKDKAGKSIPHKRVIKTKPTFSRILYFGQRVRPKLLVVMFHGYADTAGANKDWAKQIAAHVPGALVVVPQSPEECVGGRTYWGDDVGYDWLRQQALQDTSDKSANLCEFNRVAKRRQRGVDAWLIKLLAKHRLTEQQVVLMGLSQGAIPAALVGAWRRVLGVVMCGGIPWQQAYSATKNDYVGEKWNNFQDLLPTQTPTRFLAINGTRDTCVFRKHLQIMFEPYNCEWRWYKGLGHDFPKSWNNASIAWIRRLMAERKQ